MYPTSTPCAGDEEYDPFGGASDDENELDKDLADKSAEKTASQTVEVKIREIKLFHYCRRKSIFSKLD